LEAALKPYFTYVEVGLAVPYTAFVPYFKEGCAEIEWVKKSNKREHYDRTVLKTVLVWNNNERESTGLLSTTAYLPASSQWEVGTNAVACWNSQRCVFPEVMDMQFILHNAVRNVRRHTAWSKSTETEFVTAKIV
jgi:hypothetical protein